MSHILCIFLKLMRFLVVLDVEVRGEDSRLKLRFYPTHRKVELPLIV